MAGILFQATQVGIIGIRLTKFSTYPPKHCSIGKFNHEAAGGSLLDLNVDCLPVGFGMQLCNMIKSEIRVWIKFANPKPENAVIACQLTYRPAFSQTSSLCH